MSPAIGYLREGDPMLFRGQGGAIDHVALYAGHDRMLHSSSSGHGVLFDDPWSERGAYYRSHLVAARRVTGDRRAWIEALERVYRGFPFDHFDPPDEAFSPRRRASGWDRSGSGLRAAQPGGAR